MASFSITVLTYLSGIILSLIAFPIYFYKRMNALYNVDWDKIDTMFCILCTVLGSLVWPIAWPMYLSMMRKP